MGHKGEREKTSLVARGVHSVSAVAGWVLLVGSGCFTLGLLVGMMSWSSGS